MKSKILKSIALVFMSCVLALFFAFRAYTGKDWLDFIIFMGFAGFFGGVAWQEIEILLKTFYRGKNGTNI